MAAKVTRRTVCAQAFAAALFGAARPASVVFCCDPGNDVYRASGGRFHRFDTPAEAVREARDGSGVLILADGYPSRTTAVDAAMFEEAGRKKLRLYVEYPAALPRMRCGPPRRSRWERAVVASEVFGPQLRQSRILAIHDCRHVPVEHRTADIVLARVAGFDTAVYGLPETGVHPILFEHPAEALLVSTTKLSQFVRGRYAPVEAWTRVWQHILGWAGAGSIQLEARPSVAPAFPRGVKLPANAEQRALEAGVQWYENARLLIHPAWAHKEGEAISYDDRVADAPARDWPAGDGSLGLLEGFSSSIRTDGSQPVRWWLRADCIGESSFALVLGGKRTEAANLNDFIYTRSNLAQGPRAEPRSASYGLVAWNTGYNGVYYGDDNARMMLGTIGAAAALASDRWDEPLLRCLLANLRTTGRRGFRGDRLEEADLQKNGWRHYFERENVNYAPHFECYLWATYLWAWDKTKYEPFLTTAKKGIVAMMGAYPAEWRWTNGIQQERARMLLPLAWLVRVDPAAEHQAWLDRIAGELLKSQDASGAIREEIGSAGKGRYGPPKNNAEYGTTEAPLIQENGDPLCDLLYTTNFAFLGLHEANAATKGRYREAESRLGQFLCRVQAQSEQRPELNGAWFRAFDFGRWEYWASNSDAGWGAWSIESGWTQAWIAATLALRQRKTSLWDMSSRSTISKHMEPARAAMMPE